MNRPQPLDFLLLITLGMIFGSSFVFIKTAVETVPPLMVVGLRVTFAAIFLNILLKVTNKRLVILSNKWKDYAIQGVVGYTIPFYLISYGSQKLDSSYVATMMASLPIITLMIAHFFTPDEKMSVSKIVGLSVGFIGVMLLILQNKIIHNNNSLISCLMVLAGCIFFAVSSITGKRFNNDSPLITTTGALTCAAIYLLPTTLLMYFVEKPIIYFNSFSAVAVLGLLCTGIAYYIFFYLLSKIGATWTSIHDYFVPIFGAIFGVLLFQDKISSNEIIGVIMIFFSMLIMYLGEKYNHKKLRLNYQDT